VYRDATQTSSEGGVQEINSV